MTKALPFILVLLICVIGGELWFYTLSTQKQKNLPINSVDLEQNRNVTGTPQIDPFKQKEWLLTDIYSYSDIKGHIDAAIVTVEKTGTSSSLFTVRFINNQTATIQTESNTKFYSRTISQDGFSSTVQENTPFPIVNTMLLLVTWRQYNVVNGRIIPLTITRKL